MKDMRSGVAALTAASCVFMISTPASAQSDPTDAYATSSVSGGVIWRNPFGLCWRAGTAWAPSKAVAECDPDLVAKPKPAAPAPRAAPAPPPVVAAIVDSDGDGVPDDRDKCPGTPRGAKVDANGCELDSDGDGVIDRLDKCPGTPRGAAVDAEGCELDSDHDGVVDRLDKCPGTRAGAKVDTTGCEIQEVIVLKGVNFATNSARLTGNSTTILDEAAATLVKRGDVKTEVAGHTDNRGSAQRNRTLSQARAEAVMRYLVSKGVNANNLTAKGYGQDNPVADNATESGRAANRRVELRVIR